MSKVAGLAVWVVITGLGCAAPIDVVNGFVFNLPEPALCNEEAESLTPADFDLAFEPFSVQPTDGDTVRGWFIQAATADSPRGTVMLNNPSKGFRACFLQFLAVLAEDGYNVVSYDYEGFADSDGIKGVEHLARDAQAVFDWVIESDDPARQSLAIVGVSLGTGPSLMLAARYPQRVWAVVLDSAYAIPPQFDVPSLAGLFSLVVPYALPGFPSAIDNSINIESVQAPLLMLHGDADPLTAVAGAQMVFAGAPNGVKFVEFPDLGHVEAIFVQPDLYEQEVLSFLNSFAPGN